jgi:hypothetical protein
VARCAFLHIVTLCDKVCRMEHTAATEHLQVIRTLMERSALYRRTLAPVMLYVGAVGVLASLGGLALGIEGLRSFGAWWLAAAVVALAGAFAIARRQAVHDGEPFWSPPTVRVTQATMPPLSAGLLLSLALLVFGPACPCWLFILANTLFYACAVHASGFFMPRGMKLFGWLIIAVAGVALLGLPLVDANPGPRLDHVLMGALFGVGHLAYGTYLYATEQRKTKA